MKSPAARYGFINAKLRARIGGLLSEHVISDMIRAGSFVEAVAVLRDTQFAPVAQAFDKTGDLQQMEMVLFQSEIAMYEEVASYMKGAPGEFVRVLTEKPEIENLKNTLRLWYSNAVRHHPIGYLGSYIVRSKIINNVDWTALVNAPDWDSVVLAVKGTPYEQVLSQYTMDTIQKNGLFSVEMALDKLWYNQLAQGARNLSKKDRETVKDIYSVDIDLKNVLLLVRFGWYHAMNEQQLRDLLIPGGTIYGSKDLDKYLSESPAARNPSMLLSRRFPELAEQTDEIARGQSTLADSTDAKVLERKNEIIAQQTLRIEQYLGVVRRKEFVRILSGDPFTIGIALAYFFLYKQEDQMIRAAIGGKYYGWSEQQIREVMK